MNIHIIGGGNLGVAIALGISKFTNGHQLTITRRNIESIQYLTQNGIIVSSNNTQEIQISIEDLFIQSRLLFLFDVKLNDPIDLGPRERDFETEFPSLEIRDTLVSLSFNDFWKKIEDPLFGSAKGDLSQKEQQSK